MTDSGFEKLQALLSQCMALFEEEKAARESEQSEELKGEENTYGLEIYFIDVGQGDATNKAEAVLLASCPELKSNVLKVGHHGSSEATSEAFLEAVTPMARIISCGENNSYGHPAEDLLDGCRKRM